MRVQWSLLAFFCFSSSFQIVRVSGFPFFLLVSSTQIVYACCFPFFRFSSSPQNIHVSRSTFFFILSSPQIVHMSYFPFFRFSFCPQIVHVSCFPLFRPLHLLRSFGWVASFSSSSFFLLFIHQIVHMSYFSFLKFVTVSIASSLPLFGSFARIAFPSAYLIST